MIEPKVKRAELSSARIKTIIKSTESTGNITREGLFVMTRATEMFIQYLARNLYRTASTGTIQYNHLAQLVNEVGKLDFLSQIIPQKITVKRYREIMMAKEDEENSLSSSEDEETVDRHKISLKGHK